MRKKPGAPTPADMALTNSGRVGCAQILSLSLSLRLSVDWQSHCHCQWQWQCHAVQCGSTHTHTHKKKKKKKKKNKPKNKQTNKQTNKTHTRHTQSGKRRTPDRGLLHYPAKYRAEHTHPDALQSATKHCARPFCAYGFSCAYEHLVKLSTRRSSTLHAESVRTCEPSRCFASSSGHASHIIAGATKHLVPGNAPVSLSSSRDCFYFG